MTSGLSVGAGAFELIYDPSVGEDERWYINDHTIIRDRTGLWHLIGITHAEPANPLDERQLAHATAADLRGPWTKQPPALMYDPSLGETVLWAPHVIWHDNRYWMFVCGGGASSQEFRIILATSDDCTTWTRHPANPLVLDGYEARDPMVFKVGDRWVMYYCATTEPSGGAHVVKTVESHDLVHWTNPSVAYTDQCQGDMGGPTESPYVIEADGTYLLFIGPDWEGLLESHARTGRYDPAAYRRTRVLASQDPLHFEASGLAGTVDAHAAEVIEDVDGSLWITHCGWGQGGVHLAPLHISSVS
jgi:arabinan endo-1,5-alpha-L-arabinosidase